MNRLRSVLAAGIVAAAAVSANADLIVGVGNFGPFSVQSLYHIDPATGAATVIGSTGLANIADIAWNPATNTLFAYTSSADIYSINPFTGASTLVALQANTIPEGALTFSSTGQLFTSRNDQLFVLDSATAALTAVGGAMGAAADDISGLAFVGSSLLGYSKNGANLDSLVQVDTTTGIASTVGSLGFDSALAVGGLAYSNATSTLYLSNGSALLSVNPLDGSSTLIGAHGISGFSGLAVVPAPGTIVLALMGGLALSRRRR